MILQNPDGPYAIAGYSFGGYVALEMARQLKAQSREVKMLAMFDTNAEESTLHYTATQKLTRKINRQFPKFLWIVESLVKDPVATLQYQKLVAGWKIQRLLNMNGKVPEPELEGGSDHMRRIAEKHEIAYDNYRLKQYDGVIDLFKAQIRPYFVEDAKYLGWKKYARRGVRVHDVPGDHKQMLLPPNDRLFARALQAALDGAY